MTRTFSVGRTDGRRGVTLLELVVVLAIIGLIAGMSFPAISSGMDSVRLSSATQSVASLLHAACDRVERRQDAVELTFSPRQNQISARSSEPGFNRTLKLPEGIYLEAVLPRLEPEEADPVRRLVLLPGATVPGIGIQLANQHGSRRIVRLDPMTGFPRVESVQEK